MPNPRLIVDLPDGGAHRKTLHACPVCHHGLGGSCANLAQLKDAVEELAIRQDKLMDRIDTHYRDLSEKLNNPLQLKPFDSAADQLQKTASMRTLRTSGKSEGSSVGAHRQFLASRSSSFPQFTWWHTVSGRLETRWKQTTLYRWTQPGDVAESIDRFVHSRGFEIFSGGVICVNMILLFVQLDLQSCEAAVSLGRSDQDCDWPTVSVGFKVIEFVFNLWYLLELLLRIGASRWSFFVDRLNIIDVLVVCTATFQYAFSQVHPLGVAPLRIFRVLRALRVVRIIRLIAIFKELHILLKTLAASFQSLQWSICLLGAIIWSSGLLMMQFLDGYIEDVGQDGEIRESMYLCYGTPLRAGWSMFVAAFSSAWVPSAWEMVEHVNPLFGVFWVLYIVMVNFTVIRVIAALFLKQTLDISSQDAERRAMEQQKHKEQFARILHELFNRYDTSGDGKICRDEFARMVDSKRVLQKFHVLGLDHDEVCALFDVMCSDDGVADYEEFLMAAMLMNSSARAFDTIRIIHQLGSLARSIYLIELRLGIAERRTDIPGQMAQAGRTAVARSDSKGSEQT